MPSLIPEAMVEILQKKYREGQQPPNYEEQTPQLLEFLEQHRSTIDTALTNKQSNTFWEFFYVLKQDPLQVLSGSVLQDIMAFALSRDINLQDSEVQDAIDVYSVGLGTQVLRQMVETKDIHKAFDYLSDYRKKIYYDSQTPECSLDIEWSEQHEIRKAIKKYLKHLLMWGPTTEKFSTPETILHRLFKGVTTVSLSAVSAHGIQNAFPLASYLHDLFHHDVCRAAMIDSLVKFTFEKVMAEIADGMEISKLVEKHSKEATRRFDFLCKKLSEFHELAIAVNDRRAQAGLFYLFHEGGNALMRAEDWNDYQNLPKILEALVTRIKDKRDKKLVHDGTEEKTARVDDHVDWDSHLDPFVTDPHTGAIKATDEELLQEAKNKIKEFKVEAEAEKKYQETKDDVSYAAKMKANKQAKLVSVTLQKTKRFVQAAIGRTYKFEPEYMLVCTTLYHKRRNAWDTYWLLGEERGTGLPGPKTLTNREETMQYLKTLYKDKLPCVLGHTASAAKHRYQIVPYQGANEGSILFSPITRKITDQFNKALRKEQRNAVELNIVPYQAGRRPRRV